ncbi:hypothetical protein CASFOL_027816 [Castilleja foliolosa]|uniref:F-box associated beta-propeller type 1 domain-containing protein n=1 Tax=Castilleja foliolosa TaxID=1961234 RepID=A0ABD3CFV8_9LAMI
MTKLCYQIWPGFGYDAEGDDFKVVRIVFLIEKLRFRKFVSCVEVYSVNSDSWTTIDPGFQFSEMWYYWIYNSVIVNGNPYWVGRVVEEFKYVLICFDMSKLVLKIVPLTSLDYNNAEQAIEFVDLNGSLGALVFNFEIQIDLNERIVYVDTWVFDEVEQIWTKSHRVVPIEVKIMNQVLQCLKDGRVLGMGPKHQLIVFNSESKCVNGLFNIRQGFDIYDYTASLEYIQGMEKDTRWH